MLQLSNTIVVSVVVSLFRLLLYLFSKRTFYVVKLSILFLIEISLHSTLSPKSYPNMKMYNLQNNDPNKFCRGYICGHSGLTQPIVTTMLSIDNKLRNSYALDHNVSNLYMLEWYPVLQYWAQDKANLCLPPTLDEFYDFVVIQKYGIPKNHAQFKDACQVAIASQPVQAKDTTPQQMKNRITDYIFHNRLHHFKRIDRNHWALNRKQVSQVGCGYALRLNETHYIDHLVCLYCAFRFKRNTSRLLYAETKGPPCTDCNYYKTEYPWRCGQRYKHLCVASVTNETQRPQTISTSEKCRADDAPVNTKSKKTPYVDFKKPVDEFLKIFNNLDNNETVRIKAALFSSVPADQASCNHCKYLLIFAVCLTTVSLAVVFYVAYLLARYRSREKQFFKNYR